MKAGRLRTQDHPWLCSEIFKPLRPCLKTDTTHTHTWQGRVGVGSGLGHSHSYHSHLSKQSMSSIVGPDMNPDNAPATYLRLKDPQKDFRNQHFSTEKHALWKKRQGAGRGTSQVTSIGASENKSLILKLLLCYCYSHSRHNIQQLKIN